MAPLRHLMPLGPESRPKVLVRFVRQNAQTGHYVTATYVAVAGLNPFLRANMGQSNLQKKAAAKTA